MCDLIMFEGIFVIMIINTSKKCGTSATGNLNAVRSTLESTVMFNIYKYLCIMSGNRKKRVYTTILKLYQLKYQYFVSGHQIIGDSKMSCQSSAQTQKYIWCSHKHFFCFSSATEHLQLKFCTQDFLLLFNVHINI